MRPGTAFCRAGRRAQRAAIWTICSAIAAVAFGFARRLAHWAISASFARSDRSVTVKS